MSGVVVPMVESCLLLVFGIMMYRGKLTGLLAGMSLLSGERLEEAKRTAETQGVNRVMGAAIVFSAICLFLSSLFSDKRAIFGLMVAAVIISDGAHFCGVRGRAASAPLAPKAIPPRRGGQGPPL